MRYQCRLCVPDVDNVQERIMAEAHNSRYSIHPGSIKMYHDLTEVYLVEWDDEGYCRICCEVSQLSVGQG